MACRIKCFYFKFIFKSIRACSESCKQSTSEIPHIILIQRPACVKCNVCMPMPTDWSMLGFSRLSWVAKHSDYVHQLNLLQQVCKRSLLMLLPVPQSNGCHQMCCCFAVTSHSRMCCCSVRFLHKYDCTNWNILEKNSKIVWKWHYGSKCFLITSTSL